MRDLRARALLTAAGSLYDGRTELVALARRERRRGFTGGARWMAVAMSLVRGAPPAHVEGGFARLGVVKYALATAAGASVIGIAILLGRLWLAPLGLVAFYVIETRMVFAFPLAIDGDRAPLAASHALVAKHHGVARATWTVLQLAAVMLFGGLLGRGWQRSWCLGCLSVVLWYEGLRAAESPS